MVTRSTCGWSGQRASSACRMRANVLLPTATLPATPMTYGTFGAIVPRNVDRHLVQVLRRGDVQVEQPGERQVDGGDLVEVDALVDAAERLEVVLAERQRGGGAQRSPLVAVERQVPAGSRVAARPVTLRSAPCRRPNVSCWAPGTHRRRWSTRWSSRDGPRCGVRRATRCGCSIRRVATGGSSSRRGAIAARGRGRFRRRHRPGAIAAACRGARPTAPTPASTGAAPRSTSSSATRRSSTSSPPRPPRRGVAVGGGPYADAAAEFLALAVRVVRPGGPVGLVLPQSLLAARDAAAIRAGRRPTGCAALVLVVGPAGVRRRGGDVGGRVGGRRPAGVRCDAVVTARTYEPARRAEPVAGLDVVVVDRRRPGARRRSDDGHARLDRGVHRRLPRRVLRAGRCGRRRRRRPAAGDRPA